MHRKLHTLSIEGGSIILYYPLSCLRSALLPLVYIVFWRRRRPPCPESAVSVPAQPIYRGAFTIARYVSLFVGMLALRQARSKFILCSRFYRSYLLVRFAGAGSFCGSRPGNANIRIVDWWRSSKIIRWIQRIRTLCIALAIAPKHDLAAQRTPSAILCFRYWKTVGCVHSFDRPAAAGKAISLPLSASRMACFSNGIAKATCRSG